MYKQSTTSAASGFKRGVMRVLFVNVFLATLILLFSNTLAGQALTGSVSGTVVDSSGATVPGAPVEVINMASGDVRQTKTNGDGVFVVVALPPAKYSVKVTAAGFAPWQEDGIVISQGATVAVPNITLKVGSLKSNVEVISEGAAAVTTDNGAVSTTLNQTMVDEFTLSGRDAGELMKVMAGTATNGGLNSIASYNGADHVTGSNTGPAGAYSVNGTLPNGSMAYMLDGASLLDSGNVGTQIANINPEMVSEVKMLTSAYGAEFPKGPVVFQAYSKAGGKGFHGEGYFFARNSIFNAEDSFQKSEGNPITVSHYYYPGANIGGPVLLPFTHFNHNRDKLFFFFGYEKMYQQPAGSLQEYVVPTAQEDAGNLSQAYLNSLGEGNSGWNPMYQYAPCSGSQSTSSACNTVSIINGMVPQSLFDVNGVAYLKSMPAPTLDPSTHSGYNYGFNNTLPVNRWEQSERVDYAVNDNTKLSVSFTYQKELDENPICMWWAPSNALPYPTSFNADDPSMVTSLNFTHVFTPTLVNEFVVAYASYANLAALANPALVNPSNLGMTYKELFGSPNLQMSDLHGGWENSPAYYPVVDFTPSVFSNKFGAHKYSPSAADNLSKVWGTHAFKFGFYWADSGNKQSTGGYEGTFSMGTSGGISTQNVVADDLIGAVSNYNQSNQLNAPAEQSNTYAVYAQDSWKASRRLTINYGIRFDHVGQWYTSGSKGTPVWDPSTYSTATPAPLDTGLVWNAINSSIPLSGWKSPVFYYEPRFSVAYDLTGNAKTVIRGGASRFYFTEGPQSDQSSATQGQFSYQTPTSFLGYAYINNYPNVPTSGGSLNGGSFYPTDMNDSKMPNSWTYNVTVSEALPFRSVAEFSWVGSRTRDMDWGGSSNNHLNDVNAIPLGGLFNPDPISGAAGCVKAVSCPNINTQDYGAYPVYQELSPMTHGSYSNFNSFQATWTRAVKPAVVVANYTFGKVLGTFDGQSANGSENSGTVDGLSLGQNYGVESYDHTQILNLSYSLDLPKLTHDRALGEAINGWTLSGWTGVQTGQPLETQAVGFNSSWPSNISNEIYLGTNAIQLMPNLVCNPKSNLSSGQRFNPACFAPPAPGTNGTMMMPFMPGPAIINSDMSLFKSFQLTESKKIQVRLQAYNFLNHPNSYFNVNGTNDINLNFQTTNGLLSQTNTNANTTGAPIHTLGNRLVELAIKFYF
jgi:hypothetical protein